ncbi:TPA: hypothetical protein KOX39_003405 [Clostridioides difficile]|nr:hypothetical protein [Clostridioides difficile]
MAKNIVVLDKERELKYDLNALELVEEMTGVTLDKATENVSMKTLKVLLYSGLVHQDPDLTVDYVGSLVTMENIKEVSEALTKCFKNLQK